MKKEKLIKIWKDVGIFISIQVVIITIAVIYVNAHDESLK